MPYYIAIFNTARMITGVIVNMQMLPCSNGVLIDPTIRPTHAMVHPSPQYEDIKPRFNKSVRGGDA